MAAAQTRRESRRAEPALIVAEGYLPEEVGTVISLRTKREEWQKLGVEAVKFILDELKVVEDEFAQTQTDVSGPRMWRLYRSSRPLIGSTLDDGGKGFYPEFEPAGDLARFSSEAVVARIEKGLSRFRESAQSV